MVHLLFGSLLHDKIYDGTWNRYAPLPTSEEIKFQAKPNALKTCFSYIPPFFCAGGFYTEPDCWWFFCLNTCAAILINSFMQWFRVSCANQLY
jgi:hypothetical protein